MAVYRRRGIATKTQQDHTRIFLFRHPQVQGHDQGRFWGQTDVALTTEGKEQAEMMGRMMSGENLQAVYTSDLRRARIAAEAVARSQSPRLRLVAMPELRELDLGTWEGLTADEVKRRYPGQLTQRMRDLVGYQIEGGETMAQLSDRVVEAFRKIVADHMGQNVAVVAHAGVNRVLLTKLLGAPMERMFRLGQDYGCLNVIDVFPDGIPVVQRINSPLYNDEDQWC